VNEIRRLSHSWGSASLHPRLYAVACFAALAAIYREASPWSSYARLYAFALPAASLIQIDSFIGVATGILFAAKQHLYSVGQGAGGLRT
jgi:hypothetical protein